MSEHSPTPWRFEAGREPARVRDAAGSVVIYEPGAAVRRAADLAFLLAAVNAHEALSARVAALEAALRELVVLIDGEAGKSPYARVVAAMQAARAALGEGGR